MACNDEQIKELAEEIRQKYPNLTDYEIEKAINSCCNENNTFEEVRDCAMKRAKQIYYGRYYKR